MSELPDRTEVLVVGAGPVGWRLPPRWPGMAMTSRWLIGRRQERIPRAPLSCTPGHSRCSSGSASRSDWRGSASTLGSSASAMGIASSVRFDRLSTEYPYTLMVPQNITEQVLLDRLEELGGRVPPPVPRHRGEPDR
jgi:hypothetical protein